MNPASTDAIQAPVHGRAHEMRLLLTVLRYVLAVIAVTVALGSALLLQGFHFRGVETPLFLLAIAVVFWYGGIVPGVLALLLASLSFNYFFTEPRYTFDIVPADRAYFLAFVLFAFTIGWFSARRRAIERDLVEARDRLEIEVAERTQQANLLDLTHDTIFVRDMRDVITYWNRGAHELYGWTAQEAVGKRSHDLLKTQFPAPIEEINADLLRTARWEGELKHAKADGSEVVVSSRWSLQRDERGRAVSVLETNNDITERKRRE